MWTSAIRSRWPVVTPGFSSPSTRARTSATMRPARRMRSISARDLRVTTSDGAGGAVGRRIRDSRQQVLGDRFDGLDAVDDTQESRFVVVVDHLAEAGQLLAEARPDRLGLVVGPLDERGAVQVAHAGDLGRVRVLVVDVAGVATDPASGQAADELVGGHVDADRPVDG